MAQLTLEAALRPEPFREVAEILEDLDVRFDHDGAHEVHVAEVGFYAVAVNAAFLLHEDGTPEREVDDYLQTWALGSEERAERTVAFVADPEARAYVPAYPKGLRLCSAFAAREPGNHTRLLTDQLTTADLRTLDP